MLLSKRILHFKYINKSNIFASILNLLLFMNILFLYKAFSINEKPILISITENGTKIIDEKDIKSREIEKKEFIHYFIFYYYNYQSNDFQERVSKISDYFSLNEWNTQKTKLLEINEQIKNKYILQTTKIESISNLNENTYQIYLFIKVSNEIKSNSQKYQIVINLKEVDRTKLNPYGLEIGELYENPIY